MARPIQGHERSPLFQIILIRWRETGREGLIPIWADSAARYLAMIMHVESMENRKLRVEEREIDLVGTSHLSEP